MKPLVIYHAGCWDGFCAAWIARKALGPDCEFLPANYGDKPPDAARRDVYILDFSYKADVLRGIAAFNNSLTVLDHHKTAEADIAEAVAKGEGKIVGRFDLNKSGGRLAWEYFYGRTDGCWPKLVQAFSGCDQQTPPWLVAYTEDRDLWRWALTGSREVNAALRTYPLDFDTWDNFAASKTNVVELIREGAAILRAQNEIVKSHVGFAKEVNFDGHQILAVNATCHVSEIAGELAKGRPFGAVYFDAKDDSRVWSLRSDENGMDVSEIAKKHGGGGHARAAGFSVPATGALGTFSEGRLDRSDEGDLVMAIAADKKAGIVRVDFGKPVAWLGMPRAQALGLADSLREKAAMLKS